QQQQQWHWHRSDDIIHYASLWRGYMSPARKDACLKDDLVSHLQATATLCICMRRALLHIQGGAPGDPRGRESDRDEAHRRRRHHVGAGLSHPVRPTHDDLSHGQLGPAQVLRRRDIQGDDDHTGAGPAGAARPDTRRHRRLRSRGHHHDPRLDDNAPGRQHGDIADGHGLPAHHPRHTHTPSVLDLRHDVRRVQAADRRAHERQDILPRRRHVEPAQTHTARVPAQEVRRQARRAALLQVDRGPEQESPSRQGDEEPGLRRARRRGRGCGQSRGEDFGLETRGRFIIFGAGAFSIYAQQQLYALGTRVRSEALVMSSCLSYCRLGSTVCPSTTVSTPHIKIHRTRKINRYTCKIYTACNCKVYARNAVARVDITHKQQPASRSGNIHRSAGCDETTRCTEHCHKHDRFDNHRSAGCDERTRCTEHCHKHDRFEIEHSRAGESASSSSRSSSFGTAAAVACDPTTHAWVHADAADLHADLLVRADTVKRRRCIICARPFSNLEALLLLHEVLCVCLGVQCSAAQ
ncbi:unnamed protein product, partial [Trichogramma brassicae]